MRSRDAQCNTGEYNCRLGSVFHFAPFCALFTLTANGAVFISSGSNEKWTKNGDGERRGGGGGES